MTWLADKIAEMRESRLYDVATPPLWSNDEFVRNFNDAVRQVCIRQRALLEHTSSDVCSIAVSAGQQLVDLHPSILAVRFARQDGVSPCDTRPLGITAKRLFRERPQWDSDTTTDGNLEFWIPDYQTGKLALYPLPTQDYTLRLGVWRMPLPAEEFTATDIDGPDKLPVISPVWHTDLLDWVEFRCFSKPDADAESQQLASAAAARFTAKVGRLPSATEIRLWGVSPVVGVPAEFI